MARDRLLRPAVAAVLCLTSAPVTAQAPLRPQLEGFGAALDRAVRRVSRAPAPVAWASGGTRGYHLPGVGAVFVVGPRTLPTGRARADREALRALDQALANLEQSLRGVRSAETREQILRSLEMLRQTRAELEGGARMALWPPFLAPMPPSAEAERELRTASARELSSARAMEAEHERMLDAAAREMDVQVRALHERAEGIRRQAEEARREAEQRIRLQLEPPPPGPPAAPPAAPAPAPQPAQPPPAGAVPPAAPVPPLLAAPPWHLWFEAVDGPEKGDAEDVVAEVRAAVLDVLEREGQRLHLPPEESIVVAVDFLPRGLLGVAGRPQKTLVMRARKKDVDERGQGRLAAEEFRTRVHVAEY